MAEGQVDVVDHQVEHAGDVGVAWPPGLEAHRLQDRAEASGRPSRPMALETDALLVAAGEDHPGLGGGGHQGYIISFPSFANLLSSMCIFVTSGQVASMV